MTFFEKNIFKHPTNILPGAYALDGFRRVWLGGSNIAFFIKLAAGYQAPSLQHLATFQTYINMERAVWNAIPPALQLPLTPFVDYTNACQSILDMFNYIQSTNPLECNSCEECQATQHTPEPPIL